MLSRVMSNSDFLAVKTAKSCLVNRAEKIAMSKLNRQPDSNMVFYPLAERRNTTGKA